MADAEDLKSSGDFSSCGFDSHPGHQSLCFVFIQLTGPFAKCTEFEEQVESAEQSIKTRLETGPTLEPGDHRAELKETSGEMSRGKTYQSV